MKFKTMYDPPLIDFYSETGKPMREDRVLAYSSDGVAYLRTVGEHDQQAEIDSFRDSCDISVILNKIATGEISTEFTEEDCLDMVEMPQSLVECLNVRDEWESQALSDPEPEIYPDPDNTVEPIPTPDSDTDGGNE